MTHVIGSCEVMSSEFVINILIDILISIISVNQSNESVLYVIVDKTNF